jgi:malonate transporter and related proteins
VNIGGLVGALLPVFFVLALGYLAGKAHSFSQDQAGGLSKLALTFALPASLFASMAQLPRPLLLAQGRLIFCLILVHVGLFLIAWRLLRLVKALPNTVTLLWALAVSTSATPVFGIAVLQPLLGATSTGTVGLVALAINLTVPLAVVLLEIAAAQQRRGEMSKVPTSAVTARSPVIMGLNAGLQSPLLWAPVLGIALVLAGMRLPTIVASCLELIGSATSGVAVFTVGLTLAAHAIRWSPSVFIGTLARMSVQSTLLFALVHLLGIESPFVREALLCCSFPLATIVVLFAARYKAAEAETASMLMFSTLGLAVTVPVVVWLTR